ncbi:RNA 2',3'-cyclic phosphodiesterase [Cupriavidus necator]|uniref:RNA 2',3'-cyclic phosphodiesterase n=1 Tax=Cupriavidus necator TaxID=106590 RepID=UPI00339D7AD0
MPRLFIAVEVPPAQAARLLSTLPAASGLRPVPPEQVHLTLHFLGECEALVGPVEAALGRIRVPAFTLQTFGTGRFRSGQGSVLWAGLAPGPGLDTLRVLHAAAGQALADGTGMTPERRRFHPHLTLARCKPSVPESVLRGWLDTSRTLASEPWPVQRLVLFESRLGPQGAQHLVHAAWPLMAAPSPGC